MMSVKEAVNLAKLWTLSGGKCKVDLGALEPLLWKDGNFNIVDLVHKLSEIGCKVTMTTNGNILYKYARDLHSAGLSKLRISWHTCDPITFYQISGGHGQYRQFIRGLSSAADVGLNMVFNRVLLNGFCEDLPQQLDFIESHDLRLKLYDLIWTPHISNEYEKMYIPIPEVLEKHVSHRVDKIKMAQSSSLTRGRQFFFLKKGGSVEVKTGNEYTRNSAPCKGCQYRDLCLENFGDYARVDSNLNFYSCYLRKDLGFNIKKFVQQGLFVDEFLNEIGSSMQGDASVTDFVQQASLRFTIIPRCNFNCRLPGSDVSWCMEYSPQHYYPKAKEFPLISKGASHDKHRHESAHEFARELSTQTLSG